MDFRKVGLYVAIIVVALVLWNDWQREFPAQNNSQSLSTAVTVTPNNNSSVPTITPTQQTHTAAPMLGNHGQFVTVKTDVLNVTIDTLGGNVVQSQLLNYTQEQNNKADVQLFSPDADNYYVAQSGLTSADGPDTQHGQVTYSPEAASYTMSPDQQTLTVKLFWNGNGLSVVKSFIFTKGSYDIQMKYDVTNRAGKAWTGYVYTQLARTEPLQQSSLLTHYATFTGGAISSPSDHYQKIKFDNFGTDATNQTTTQGWAAMVQQYFLSAWVPDPTLTYHYYSSVNNSTGVYTLGMMSSALTVSPGQTITANNQLYVGPAIASNLNQVSPHLSMTIDYGWLWFISQIIFWAMKIIFDIIGNWGWAIIVVTLIIKAIFYPLSNKSFHSMAKMRKLQPRIAQLKERFGDDRQAMSKAMMDLYREEKVNPLGGCLPMLVQIPVFIGLYWVIVQSVELRQAPWILWVNDLSIHDAYYILPVIMGGLMFLQQKLSPPPPDPTQAKVMMFMPIIFTALFLGFPSGLVLYWITNTLVTVIHQYVILLKYEREEKEKKITKANQKK